MSTPALERVGPLPEEEGARVGAIVQEDGAVLVGIQFVGMPRPIVVSHLEALDFALVITEAAIIAAGKNGMSDEEIQTLIAETVANEQTEEG